MPSEDVATKLNPPDESPIKICPNVGAVVVPVPPLATGRTPLNPIEFPVHARFAPADILDEGVAKNDAHSDDDADDGILR